MQRRKKNLDHARNGSSENLRAPNDFVFPGKAHEMDSVWTHRKEADGTQAVYRHEADGKQMWQHHEIDGRTMAQELPVRGYHYDK
jgi:hypothetical protein